MTTSLPTDLRAVRTAADLTALCAALAARGGGDAQQGTPADSVAVRALVGANAVLPYMGDGGVVDDFESAFADLLGDLRHLAAALDVDWDAADRRAAGYHREESGDSV